MSSLIPVFLSYPSPHLKQQEDFIKKIELLLLENGFYSKTIKLSSLAVDDPLHSIRRAMTECCGLIAVAFKRTLITKGEMRPGCDNGTISTTIDSEWMSSPYSHIEPAMAFQAGLPILILKEMQIRPEGMLERAAPGIFLKDFDLGDNITIQIHQSMNDWTGQVKKIAREKLRSIA